jgi:endonuclease/exonuclease/phosphatase family metal-dependent hydrolase
MTPALVVILLAFSSPLRQASMVTWNVLAPAFANQQKFPWASSQALSWSNRRERIVQQLSTIDADCICLQEVEVERWPELHAQLGELGYGGVLQETGGHPFGVAMLFKSDRLVCLRTESRSRAMIAVVQAAQAGAGAAGRGGGELLYLANVHLEAGPQKEQQRMLQLASLLKRVRFQAEQDGAMPHVDGALPLIIAGDFNCEPRSAPHRMLSQAPRHPEKRHGLCLRRALARMRPGLVALGPPECIPAGRPSQLGGGAWPHEPPSRCPEEGGAGRGLPLPFPLVSPRHACLRTTRSGLLPSRAAAGPAASCRRRRRRCCRCATHTPRTRRRGGPRCAPPTATGACSTTSSLRPQSTSCAPCRSAPARARAARTGCRPSCTRRTTYRSARCCGGPARRSRRPSSAARGSPSRLSRSSLGGKAEQESAVVATTLL